MELKNETPSKSKTLMKVRNNNMSCDSPFRLLPNISTPPSRFSKILNPFEQHIIDRLHLPTFSPSVFAQVSTPKTEEKFKWTIDDISSLKPADIDEATISQHVSDHDPMVESMVQEKIDKFFNEKAIVPSPLNEQIKQVPLWRSPPDESKPQCFDSCTQTVLTLPPKLPKEVEEALAPYFNYNLDQDDKEMDQNSSLYRKLFEFEEHISSPVSSPPLSTGLSPIQFSPEFNPLSPKTKLESTCTLEMPELRDCTLSPIGRSPASRSACRLNFSSHMSVDASMTVPDVNKSLSTTNLEASSRQILPQQPLMDSLGESTCHWDMEYKRVSILSKSPESSPELPDSSNSNTPHSRIFTSQRKRLSDSFKDEQLEKDVDMVDEETFAKRLKNAIDDVMESGYHTGGATLCESSVYLFASTPTKVKH